MKLRKEFLTKEMGDGQVMISADQKLFAGIVTSNSTAAFIVNCLKNETTVQDIVKKMADIYDAPQEVIRKDVLNIVKKLKAINAIDDFQTDE